MRETCIHNDLIEEVLVFWFEELSPEQWFKKDAVVDAAVRAKFSTLYEELAGNGGQTWTDSPRGCLAAVIVLDQFPRNLYRDDRRAYTTDAVALTIAKSAVHRGFDEALSMHERKFLFMPFQHCEDVTDQNVSVELFSSLGDPKALEYAIRHKDVVERFGRFPHRNAALGRMSTPEELEFLTQPGSSF